MFDWLSLNVRLCLTVDGGHQLMEYWEPINILLFTRLNVSLSLCFMCYIFATSQHTHLLTLTCPWLVIP